MVATPETVKQLIGISDAVRVLPDELRKSSQFCFWGVDTDQIKRPATWDGSKWDFGGWNKNPDKLLPNDLARELAH